MRNALILIFLLVGITYMSCENENEEDLFGKEECDTVNVTFSGDFLPILESICYDCHSKATQTAPFLLEGYDNVKFKVDEGRLEGAINHRQGYSPMPKFRDKLPDCNLAKINSWINDGAPEN